MDRVLVFPGAIPLDTDQLNASRFAMIAIGKVIEAILGTVTAVAGLACTPTAPASMTVNVGPGSIVNLMTIDASAFGSLDADSNPLMKMGINTDSTPFTLTAPTTSGQSVNYLVQASLQEADIDQITLPYYNADDPTQPYSGPSNSGVPQNTVRQQKVALQLKAGAPANAGSQVTPTVDAGWTGIYVITVNYGQSTITAGAITRYSNAPFIAGLLSSHHSGAAGQAPKINLGSEVQGVLAYANMSPVRQLITQDTTIYVNATTGNDSFNGLTAGTAFRSLQAAINTIYRNYDWNGFSCTISLADGSYTNGSTAFVGNFTGLPPGLSLVNILGNIANPGNVQLIATSANGIGAFNGANISIQGVKITATGTPTPFSGTGWGLLAQVGGAIAIKNSIIGSCSSAQTFSSQGSTITFGGGNMTLTGNTPAALQVGVGSLVYANNATITVTGLTVATAFAAALTQGIISIPGATFVGSASGPRYFSYECGVIDTNGGGSTYLPGSTAGTAASGGQYI